jgi:hypothetical protein
VTQTSLPVSRDLRRLGAVVLSERLFEALQSPRAQTRKVVRSYLADAGYVVEDLAGDPRLLEEQSPEVLALVYSLALRA